MADEEVTGGGSSSNPETDGEMIHSPPLSSPQLSTATNDDDDDEPPVLPAVALSSAEGGRDTDVPAEFEAASPPEPLEYEEIELLMDADEKGEQIDLSEKKCQNEVLAHQLDEEAGKLQQEEDTTKAENPLLPVQATPLVTEKDAMSSAESLPPPGPVYSNERVSNQRYRKRMCLVIFIILLVVVVVAVAVPLTRKKRSEQETSSTPTYEAEATKYLCDVVNLGPFYQSECELCSYTVGMDSETGIIANGIDPKWGEFGVVGRGDEKIQFLPNEGTYVPGQISPYVAHQEVAVLGNYAAFGDRWPGNGVVHMYQKNTSTGEWSNIRNMTLDNLYSEAEFGKSIEFDGTKMVVGAPGDFNEGSSAIGSVYVYQREDDGTWVEEAKLYLNMKGVSNFGFALALKGNTLVVSDGYPSAYAFVYRFNNITNEWKRDVNGTLSSKDCEGRFGHSVAVTDAGGVLVECPMEKSGTGAVYYFTPASDGNWYELNQKITAFSYKPFPKLGEKIIVDKNLLLVTTDGEDDGIAYVFELDSNGEWKEAAIIEAPSDAKYFGTDAALSGKNIFISYRGNTYSYKLNCTDQSIQR